MTHVCMISWFLKHKVKNNYIFILSIYLLFYYNKYISFKFHNKFIVSSQSILLLYINHNIYCCISNVTFYKNSIDHIHTNKDTQVLQTHSIHFNNISIDSYS